MIRFFVAAAGAAAVLGIGSSPAAIAASAFTTIGCAGPVAMTPSPHEAGTWAAGARCFYPNCAAAHRAGEGNITEDSPHYCARQDADADGFACEW